MAYRSTPIVVTSGTPGRTPTRAAGRPRFVKSRPGARCTAGCRRAFYSTTRCIVVSVRLSSAASAFTTVYRLSPSTRRGAGTRTRIGAGFGFRRTFRTGRIVRESRRPRSRVAPVTENRLTSPATPGHARSQTPTRPARRRGARPSAARPARVGERCVTAKCVRG